MADNFNIYKWCINCNKTGKLLIQDESYDPGPPIEVDCNVCDGEGKLWWGEILEQEV